MKNRILYILFLIITIAGINKLSAQEISYNKHKNNYFVLSKNIGEMNAIIASAKDQQMQDGKKYGEFHVVICGKAVNEMLKDDVFQPILSKAKQQGVKIYACGFSLNKFKIDPSSLPTGVGVVENGISYGFALEKKGFNFITL